MNSRKGISLMMLVITIIITIILASVTIVGIDNSMDKARLGTFAEDLRNITEKAEVFYYENNELPYLETDVAMSQGEFLQLAGASNKDELMAEMTLNGDKMASDELGAFYKIDLAKIGVKKISRGTLKSGSNDVFVLSYPSMKVYYAQGLKIGSKKYFSITPDLTNITKISEPALEEIGSVLTKTLPGITIKKRSNVWINNLGLTVSGYLGAGDELYLTLSTGVESKIYLEEGKFTNFEILTLLDLVAEDKVDLTSLDVRNFLQLPNNERKITFTKKENSVIVGTVEIDFSNFDYIKPLVSNDEINMKLVDGNVNCKFKVSDDLSGVKEVRYYTVTNQNIESDIYTEQFVKTRGKKANLSQSGDTEFNFSPDVRKVIIAVIDRAGNISLYTKTNPYYSPYIFSVSNAGAEAVNLDRDFTTNVSFTVTNFDTEFCMARDIEYTISISNLDGSSVDNLDFEIDGETSVNDKITKTIAGGARNSVTHNIKLIVPNGKKLYNTQEIKVKLTPVDKTKFAREFKITISNNILRDYSQNKLDGSLKNGIQVIKDQDGMYALRFDGIDDFVQIPTIAAGKNSGSGIRIEMEVTWDAFNTHSRVLTLGSGYDKGSIFIKNTGNTGELFFRANTKWAGIRLDLYTINKNAITLGKKSKYYLRWVEGGKGEGGVALWWRGDMDIDGVTVDREDSDLMHGTNPIATGERTTNYLGKSDVEADGYFQGKIYSIKVMNNDWSVLFEYDLNKSNNR